jgi:hypothetical protein
LKGEKPNNKIVIDNTLSLSNHLLVTGTLHLYGYTNPSFTKLTSVAEVGDKTINVVSTTGWEIGNVIGIAPTNG